MSFLDLLQFVKENGFLGILGLLSLYIIYIIIKSRWPIKIFTKLISKIKQNKYKTIKPPHIYNHDIFDYIDHWIESRIPTIKFSTPFRTVVFRKYLTIYLKTYKNVLLEFLSSKKFEDLDDSEIWKIFLNLINKIIHDYELEMKNATIPDIVIEKMKLKNKEMIDLTIDLIESICTSEFYASKNNILKIYSILNIIYSVLENTISKSEETCNTINGEFKGVVFHDGGTQYIEN